MDVKSTLCSGRIPSSFQRNDSIFKLIFFNNQKTTKWIIYFEYFNKKKIHCVFLPVHGNEYWKNEKTRLELILIFSFLFC
jgi:hypothetical protein